MVGRLFQWICQPKCVSYCGIIYQLRSIFHNQAGLKCKWFHKAEKHLWGNILTACTRTHLYTNFHKWVFPWSHNFAGAFIISEKASFFSYFYNKIWTRSHWWAKSMLCAAWMQFIVIRHLAECKACGENPVLSY